MKDAPRTPRLTLPQTRAQRQVYGLCMSLLMTFGMELYNNAVKLGVNLAPGGMSNLSWDVLPEVGREMTFIVPLVWALSTLYGNRLGARIAASVTDPERDGELWRSCVVIACTTMVMCPSMSLFASALFNVALAGRPVLELPIIWLGTLFKNFPVALLWNLFVASPLSRLCLRALFAGARPVAVPAGRPARP